MKTELALDEYLDIIQDNVVGMGLTWGKFQDLNNMVIVTDMEEARVFFVFDSEEDAILFKLRHM